MRMGSVAAVGLIAWAGAAAAQRFDTHVPDAGIAGRRSQVLVLGTPHLDGMPAGFDAANLSALLDRLAAWRPEAITIEALSGAQCDQLRRYVAIYPQSAETYCWDPAPARAATGLDVPAATAEIERRLAAWPAAPTPADRRRLAALFIAAGERPSALVQWLRLPAAERHAGDGLDATLVGLLERSRTAARNENNVIGAALAARLGLERVYAVDDHTSDDASGDDPGFEAAMSRIWDNAATRQLMARTTAAEAAATTPAGVLALYRYMNAPDQPRIAFRSDFGAALADATPQQFGRRYLGGWETRNLRMVANIRAVLARRPGMRLLSIVGASHRAYFEAYLAPMHDVTVVDTATVLR